MRRDRCPTPRPRRRTKANFTGNLRGAPTIASRGKIRTREERMLKITKTSLILFTALALGTAVATEAATLEFNFDESTPVGSWQEREQVSSQGGKQTVTVMKVKYLGDEERNGETYAWVETELENFKIKKSNRKQTGDTTYVKALLKKSLLRGDVVNSIGNFHDIAEEIIMQTGDAQPMRIKNAGEMMGGLVQATGLQISYEFAADGSESIEVPAGVFSCERYKGHGTATMDLMIKKMNVESTSTQWISEEVPFGVVKVISDDVVNGKPRHSETSLTAFGRSGATSMVTGEPQDMPSMGSIFGG
jgi:hypothetical protein